MRKLTTEEVKKRVIDIHGDRYDLSKLIYKNRRTKVEMICKAHGSWMTKPDQLFRGQGCPTCGGKVITSENSLEENYPNLLSEWDYDKNEILPSQVGIGSHKSVWWRCQYGHSYDMPVKRRTRNGKGQNCPYCSNLRIDETNSIRTLKPEWLSEWDYDKNDKRTPDNTGINSYFKVYWKCQYGHEWQVSPTNRHTYGTDCPNCAVSGYKTSIDGFFYIHLIVVGSKRGLKYGITNFPEDRMKHLLFRNKRESKFSENLKIKNLYILKGSGSEVLRIEGLIRELYGKKYFTREEFPQGYTETIPFEESKPKEILEKLTAEGLEVYSSNL